MITCKKVPSTAPDLEKLLLCLFLPPAPFSWISLCWNEHLVSSLCTVTFDSVKSFSYHFNTLANLSPTGIDIESWDLFSTSRSWGFSCFLCLPSGNLFFQPTILETNKGVVLFFLFNSRDRSPFPGIQMVTGHLQYPVGTWNKPIKRFGLLDADLDTRICVNIIY